MRTSPLKNARRGLRAFFSKKAYQTRRAARIRPRAKTFRLGNRRLSCSADVFHCPSSLGDAKAEVVVAIPRRVVVAVRRSTVPGVVVPTAAAIHAVRASFGQDPSMSSILCKNTSRPFGRPERVPASRRRRGANVGSGSVLPLRRRFRSKEW